MRIRKAAVDRRANGNQKIALDKCELNFCFEHYLAELADV